MEASTQETLEPPFVAEFPEPEIEDPRILTLVVGGQEFRVAKAFLSIHSLLWARRLRLDPSTVRVEFHGLEKDKDPEAVAEEFGHFLSFLGGGEENGENTEVNAGNVRLLLRWAAEFEVDYLFSICESFLMLPHASSSTNLDTMELLELAARHDLPLLYSRCCERAAQGLGQVEVPDLAESSGSRLAVFSSPNIRDDLVTSHICMNEMRRDAEARRRIRFADYTARIPTPGQQRARVLWKNRCKLTNQARGLRSGQENLNQAQLHEPPRRSYALGEWRISPSVVWPHDSLRDHTWPMVPGETQPLC